jgi:hypothetical protein
MVAFGDKQRTLGEGAKSKVKTANMLLSSIHSWFLIICLFKAITSFKNTVTYFRNLIGRQYKHPEVQVHFHIPRLDLTTFSSPPPAHLPTSSPFQQPSDHPSSQAELKRANSRHTEMPDGTVGFMVTHDGKEMTLSVKQIMAAHLGHLKSCVDTSLESKVRVARLGRIYGYACCGLNPNRIDARS